MTTTLIGNEDHYYPCDEVSGPLLDAVGSFDSSSGTPPSGGNGIYREFNGVNNIAEWPVAVCPLRTDIQDVSGYWVIAWKDLLTSSSAMYTGPCGTGASTLGMSNFYKGSVPSFKLDMNQQGTAPADHTLPRALTHDDILAFAFSWDHSAKSATWSVKSLAGDLDWDQTFTELTLPASTDMLYGSKPSGTTKYNTYLYEMGFRNELVDATALDNTTTALIAQFRSTPSKQGGTRNPSHNGIMYEPIWSRARKRFIRN
jgi:hypothetical protein